MDILTIEGLGIRGFHSALGFDVLWTAMDFASVQVLEVLTCLVGKRDHKCTGRGIQQVDRVPFTARFSGNAGPYWASAKRQPTWSIQSHSRFDSNASCPQY
eukprot:478796-Amphidinium_carterae.1